MNAAIVGAAVILGGSVLGAAFLVTQQTKTPAPQPRYTFTVQTSREETVQIIYRLDTITGQIDVCSLERLAPIGHPHPSQPDWCARSFVLER